MAFVPDSPEEKKRRFVPDAGVASAEPDEPPKENGTDAFMKLLNRGNLATGIAEPLLQMASSVPATVLGAGAGAGAMILDAAGAGKYLPSDVQHRVTNALTYEPKTDYGKSDYNPLNMIPQAIGKGVNWVADKFQNAVAPEGSSPLREAGASGSAEAIRQGLPLLPLLTRGIMPKGEFPSSAGKRADVRTANMQSDAGAMDAKQAGYSLPPTQVNPTLVNKLLEGAAGKQKLQQDLSIKNQLVSQDKIRRDLGIPKTEPLGLDATDTVREKAGGAYDALRQSGYGDPIMETPPPVTRVSSIVDESGKPFETTTQAAPFERIPGLPATDQFQASIASQMEQIRGKIKEAPETFASLKPSLALLSDYAKKEFEPSVAVDQIKKLRRDASTEFRSDDPSKVATAQTRLEIANQLEGLFEDHLANIEPAAAKVIVENGVAKYDRAKTPLENYREARKTIAKSYTADKVINAAGEVNAPKLANLKGPKMEGEMADIANLGAHFPDVAKLPSRIGGVPSSPLDFWGSLISHTGAGLSMLTGRPLLRKLLASDAYQERFVNPPSYGPSLGARLMEQLQNPAVAAGEMAMTAEEAKKKRLAALLQGR